MTSSGNLAPRSLEARRESSPQYEQTRVRIIRAVAAPESRLFSEEIIPVTTEAGIITADQGIRPGTSLEGITGLKTPFKVGGVVTAGNASQISDGATALLTTTSERTAEFGLRRLAHFHTFALARVDSMIILFAPIPATQKVLQRSGQSISDIGAFKVEKALASVLGVWVKETGAAHELTNVNGGAMALEHPLGLSPARVMTTLVHHKRRTESRYGQHTISEGDDMANATVLERL